MKREINQGWKALLGGLLAILGFQGCERILDNKCMVFRLPNTSCREM